jgi:pimeloyl-ACP methyl ester carboxylesterase
MTAPRLKASEPPESSRRRSRWLVVLLVFVTLAAVAWAPVAAHLRALSVLLRIESSQAHGFFANRGIHPIRTEEATFGSGTRQLPTRLYVPKNVKRAPALVIVHGVHHMGYNEPRMVRFAKAMAGSGLVVATPQIPELADYEIKASSVEEIAAAANDLAQRIHAPCVGVLGLSFAGGMALQAASDPATAEHICYVVAVGAQDDMTRVMRFFATDLAEYPDGSKQPLVSHEYGALVAIYAHPEDYFSTADVPLAREAVHDQLMEKIVKAKAIAAKLSPDGQETMRKLLSQDHSAAKAVLLENIEKHHDELESVSPSAQIYRIHVPVMLLHGAGDNVIPPSETRWLEQDIPLASLREVLVSRAISHVEIGKDVTLWDKFELVHFIEEMLREARTTPYNSVELQRVGGS